MRVRLPRVSEPWVAPAMKPLVLMIEDDPQIRRFLRATLGAEGYRFQEALTGEEGLAQAAAHQPDLILLDLGLPDIDGIEVIRRLRNGTGLLS